MHHSEQHLQCFKPNTEGRKGGEAMDEAGSGGSKKRECGNGALV